MKEEVKLFLITDFEEEEEYLAAMHRKGWKWKETRFLCLFIFEKCQPAEVVYRLDFKPRLGENRDAYYKMYKDYGWEHVGICNNFAYFRKVAIDGEEMEIYSDRQTKLEMVGRIFKRRFCLLACLGVLMMMQTVREFPKLGTALCLFLFYLFLLTYCGLGFYKLRKKYKEVSR